MCFTHKKNVILVTLLYEFRYKSSVESVISVILLHEHRCAKPVKKERYFSDTAV